MTESTRTVDLTIDIPVGYLSLPLTDIDSTIATAAVLLEEAGPAATAPAADVTLPALAAFLDELGRDGVRYCGLGRHLSDDTLVTSVLTVLVYDIGGDSENPRIAIKNLAESKIEANDPGDLQVVDLDGRPMMFFEQVRDIPVPDFPGNPITGMTAPVYQLEAAVVADDGSAIASIELSTAFAAHGPYFRRMVIDTAKSVVLDIQKTSGRWLAL